jgi:LysM repeat protein
MEKRTSATARLFAAIALVVAVIVFAVAIGSALNSGSSNSGHRSKHHPHREAKRRRTKAKTYTVETGDTLTAIAHKTGVPVAEILALNPEVDPQILIAGQTLKLR